MSAPLFPLGTVIVTSGVLALTTDAQRLACLRRHVTGDFGTVDGEQEELNRYSVESGHSVLSAYPIDPANPCDSIGANAFWILTRGDRHETTLLLPDEH